MRTKASSRAVIAANGISDAICSLYSSKHSYSFSRSPQTALLRLHELALQNRLVEKFDPTADPAGGFVVKLTLGNESYSGRGNTIKAAKQNAAMQALVTTKYKALSTMKARPDGVTATSQGGDSIMGSP